MTLEKTRFTCLCSHPCLVTSALGFLRMELERFPNVAAVLGVRDVCRSEEMDRDRREGGRFVRCWLCIW